MTLDSQARTQGVPASVPRPRPARAPRPRRPVPTRAQPHVGASETETDVVDVATMASQLAAMQAKIDDLTAGKIPYVASEPANSIGAQRVAADEELTDWQLQVRNKTAPTPTGVVRQGKNYNIPPRWYMKPDGSVVQLQGDDQNFSYYTDKKRFHALTDDEVKEYLSAERPKIVKRQQERANLINVIRRAVALDPALAAGLDPSWERDLDRMTTGELQNQLDEIANTPTGGGQKRRLMRRLSRLEDADARAADAHDAALLAGVETTPTRTVREAFEQALGQQRTGGRTIEVTSANYNTFR